MDLAPGYLYWIGIYAKDFGFPHLNPAVIPRSLISIEATPALGYVIYLKVNVLNYSHV